MELIDIVFKHVDMAVEKVDDLVIGIGTDLKSYNLPFSAQFQTLF